MNDEQIRAHFAEWASPLRLAPPPDVSQIRRRARRRTTRLLAAAGSGAATIGLASLVIFGIVSASRPGPPASRPVPASIGGEVGQAHVPVGSLQADAIWGHGPYPVPPGAPNEILNYQGHGFLRVFDAADGTVLARLAVRNGVFTDIAAAPDDRMFIVAQQNSQVVSSFDEITIRGRQVQLRAVMPGVALPRGNGIYGMSVNAAGTRLALNTIAAGGVGPTWLYVYNLVTGALVDKLTDGDGSVTLQYWPSAGQLAFSYAAGSGSSGDGLRILDTSTAARPGTPVLAASAPDPAIHRYQGTLSTDGSADIEIDQAGQVQVLREYSATSGRLRFAVTIGTTTALDSTPYYCGVLGASANGADLLTQCGTRRLEIVDGRARSVRLAVTVPASPAGWADSFAW